MQIKVSNEISLNVNVQNLRLFQNEKQKNENEKQKNENEKKTYVK